MLESNERRLEDEWTLRLSFQDVMGGFTSQVCRGYLSFPALDCQDQQDISIINRQAGRAKREIRPAFTVELWWTSWGLKRQRRHKRKRSTELNWCYFGCSSAYTLPSALQAIDVELLRCFRMGILAIRHHRETSCASVRRFYFHYNQWKMAPRTCMRNRKI